MAITIERLRQTFSENGCQEIYQEVRAEGDFAGFARQYAFHPDPRVARSALWGLTKATRCELSVLQPMLHQLIDQAMQTADSSVRRLTLNIIARLEMEGDDLRLDFLDFCFDHMVRIDEYPGVQTLCMKLAFSMCQRLARPSEGTASEPLQPPPDAEAYPELMDELMRTLEAMEADYYKPAVRSLRSKMLSGKYH